METKNIFLSIFILITINCLLPTLLFAQSPNWQWAESAGGTFSDDGSSATTDSNGNVFVTGSFCSPTITFGSTTLTNAGPTGIPDMFTVKYDNSGNVLWAKNSGGTASDYGLSVAADDSGNVYVTGNFSSSTITFGSITLTNAGSVDIFIVKYDNSGNVLWVKSAGGTANDKSRSVATDSSGNVYITGDFGSTITFGSTTLTNVGGGWYDVFITKYDVMGNVLWAKSAGGTFDDNSRSVAADNNGNVYVTGYFSSSNLTFGSVTLTNAGSEDMFIVKYDASGNAIWAKSAGGTNGDYGYSVATDNSGNVYVTGDFSSSNITFGSTTLTNVGIFIVKYDVSGTALWAKSAGGASTNYGRNVSTDGSGNVYVTGYFASSPLIFGSATLTSAGNWDMFIAKLDGVTGINGFFSYENAINTFPNPSSGKFTIKNEELRSERYDVEIYNVLGKKVYEAPSLKGEDRDQSSLSQGGTFGAGVEYTIDISSQPSGVYFLTLKTTKESYTQKLIIQK